MSDNKISIVTKFFTIILFISLFAVCTITITALFTSYNTMKNQLIAHSQMSIEWLQSRLRLETEGYIRTFYEYEINQEFRSNILAWYEMGEELNFQKRLSLMESINKTVSINKNINSFELINLKDNSEILAERSGTSFTQAEKSLRLWQERPEDLQTNAVFLPYENEILLLHQLHDFIDKKPLALMVIHLHPYFIQNILDDVKSVPSELVLLFNDQNSLIEWDSPSEENPYVYAKAAEILEQFKMHLSGDIHKDGYFWFYREIDKGKLKILKAIPDNGIMEALKTTLITSMLMAVFALLLSVALAAVFSKLLGKPIITLSEKMHAFKLDKGEVIEFTPRNDEIGLLEESFAYMAKTNKDLLEKEYKSQIAKRNAQLYALQSQINPHFMYNTLQVICALALKNKGPDIYMVASDMGDILHYSLDFSNEVVELSEEIKYFRSYVSIQKKRFQDKIEVNYLVPDYLLTFKVPKLILQPILENSFKHGFDHKAGKWRIMLTATRKDEDLILILSDNGKGMTQKKLQELQMQTTKEIDSDLMKKDHIGLINVHTRIRLRYGIPYGLTIESKEAEGTSVKLYLKGNRN